MEENVFKKDFIDSATFEEFMQLKQYTQQTIYVYKSLKKHLPDTPTQEDVNQFLINRPYPTARAFLKSYVWDYRHMQREIDIIKLKAKHTHNKLILERVLNDNDYELFISKLPIRESIMCRILKECGMRQNAILVLNMSNIDLIERKLVWIDKGRKECSGYISQETKDLLLSWLKNHYGGIDKIDFSTPIFGVKRSNFWRVLNAVSKQLFNKSVSSHWMKRTCGRWLEDNGFDLEERQFYLHHSDPRTTQKHYSFKKGSSVMDKVKDLIN